MSNSAKTYTFSQLNSIRDTIEIMPKINQLGILKILNTYKNDVVINKNNYGSHINLSDLSNTIIDEVVTYINYVNTQEQTLIDIEQQKEEYKNTYFQNNNKESNTCLVSDDA